MKSWKNNSYNIEKIFFYDFSCEKLFCHSSAIFQVELGLLLKCLASLSYSDSMLHLSIVGDDFSVSRKTILMPREGPLKCIVKDGLSSS